MQADGGTWHLSALRLLTLNLRLNVEHMQSEHSDYEAADGMLFTKGET